MRILVLDTYYSRFTDSLYLKYPDLERRSYDEQLSTLLGQGFGTADFYSTNLKELGHEAAEIVSNCAPLQQQWAREHGIKVPRQSAWAFTKRRGLIPWVSRRQTNGWFYPTLSAQIQHFKPDVLYVQDINSLNAAFIREMKANVRLMVGQIACPISRGTVFRDYDLILSSLPNFVDRFRAEGLKSEYLKLAFDPKILPHLENQTRYDTVFVGTLSGDHTGRMRFLEQLARSERLKLWGHGIDSLPPGSALHGCYQGEAWALDMYQVLAQARIAINYHLDLSESYANNMRLFEATGVGTLLLTDSKANLHTMFEVGKEVVTYENVEDCIALIRYYSEHSNERDQIARAGQQRTLREHTYLNRMRELEPILESRLAATVCRHQVSNH